MKRKQRTRESVASKTSMIEQQHHHNHSSHAYLFKSLSIDCKSDPLSPKSLYDGSDASGSYVSSGQPSSSDILSSSRRDKVIVPNDSLCKTSHQLLLKPYFRRISVFTPVNTKASSGLIPGVLVPKVERVLKLAHERSMYREFVWRWSSWKRHSRRTEISGGSIWSREGIFGWEFLSKLRRGDGEEKREIGFRQSVCGFQKASDTQTERNMYARAEETSKRFPLRLLDVQ